MLHVCICIICGCSTCRPVRWSRHSSTPQPISTIPLPCSLPFLSLIHSQFPSPISAPFPTTYSYHNGWWHTQEAQNRRVGLALSRYVSSIAQTSKCTSTQSASFSGKSSLVIQFVDVHFVESYYPTIESTFTKSMKHNGVEYDCEIIDTAGQVRPISFQS